MKTNLSVNINKIALLRNSRGGLLPNVLNWARTCEEYGADGITVHPRQDERHIKYADVVELKSVVKTEFNVEGYPNERFLTLIEDVRPTQCTLVPEASQQLTSDHGWDTKSQAELLSNSISQIKEWGIRIAVFIDPVLERLDDVKDFGADRIELYTGPYTANYLSNKQEAVKDFISASEYCSKIGLGVNAGHDLNLDNLAFFNTNIPDLLEVSIGHALTNDCLFFGVENTIQMYQRELQKS